MSNPKTIEQDGKFYERHDYDVGDCILPGAMIFAMKFGLKPSANIGQGCVAGLTGSYYHEVKPEPCCDEPHCDGARSPGRRFCERHSFTIRCTVEGCGVAQMDSRPGFCEEHMPAPEMVTIEVPLQWAMDTVGDVSELHEGGDAVVYQSCKAALAARKTNLELWRESIGKAWCKSGDFLISSENDSSRPCIAKPNEDSEWAMANWNVTGKLMAAGPELAEALIECRYYLDPETSVTDANLCKAIDKAVRKAFPPEVAAEILGESG